MTDTLVVKRLRGASILRLVLTWSALGFAVIFSALSLPASMGLEVLKWNGQYVAGPQALVLGPLLGMFAGILLGLFMALPVYLGLRIYAYFRPTALEYLPKDVD